MQREHLFKGKTIKEGKWIEGSLIIDEIGNYYIGRYIATKDNNIIIGGRMTGKTLDRFIGIGFAMVDKDTVCEYTGLTDKNGNKIFENDIIRKGTTIYIIGFDDGAFGTIDVGQTDVFAFCDNDYGINTKEYEIIGNIFDNKELLE